MHTAEVLKAKRPKVTHGNYGRQIQQDAWRKDALTQKHGMDAKRQYIHCVSTYPPAA